ncbi:MAG: carbohydrate kinase [Lentisphaeria bacterium]|nr:carbohydrate kinase [Lentisphaeria bacterium]
MSLYLGIDVSTQGVKCIVIDTENGRIAAESNVNFGKDLPHYNSPDGFLHNENSLICHANPLMWVDGLELALERLQATQINMEEIRGISGSGQQHGTVYLASEIQSYKDDKKLSEQLRNIFSRSTSPIWMDRSTKDICDELNKHFGSQLITKTGSPAIERFSGPQIRAFYERNPNEYHNTEKIHLVSSFMASVLCGKNVGIDYGDGAGMNLLNLNTLNWDKELVEFTAPNLAEKLPEIMPSNSIVGKLDKYFCRFGFKAGIPIVIWSGDNPNSLIGTGCFERGVAAISLGTSDTFFMPMDKFHTDPYGYGHIFGNPAGGFMSLICFSNGSLAREKIRNLHKVDWHYFDTTAMKESTPGNNGKLMLPYFSAESTPVILQPRVVRNYDKATSAEEIRAILESQILSMRFHSEWIGENINRIRLTGGASSSPAIQQIVADVFNAEVEIIQVSNSAGLGSALRCAAAIDNIALPTLASHFCKSEKVASPRIGAHKIYKDLLKKYQELELNFMNLS